jgi:predicted secreted protein
MLIDMPFTGIGLNTFPIIVQNFYPGVASPEYYDATSVVPHVHNLFVQTALDLGLVGLAAFSAVVVMGVRGGVRAAERGVHRPLAIGLLLGLLAHGVYGMVDAVVLGAKPSPALWAFLGLLFALAAMDAPDGEPTTRPARTGVPPGSWPGTLRAGVLLFALPLMVAPLALNGALVILHRPESFGAVSSSLVEANLVVARGLAWGPYAARAWAAQALAARLRGDIGGERVALDVATRLGAWDPSLAEQSAELELVANDGDARAQPLGDTRLVEALVRRGKAAPPATALALFARAQAVAPADPRPYLAAAEVLARSRRLDDAAAMLAVAIRFRGREAWRVALAERLVDSSALLPALDTLDNAYNRDDAVLFARASQLLERRADPAGALYAEQLAARSYGLERSD